MPASRRPLVEPRRPRPVRRPVPASRRRNPIPLWGALFLVGGAVIWFSLSGPRREPAVPDVWHETRGEETAVQLQSELRPGGDVHGDLLKLEWPAHPNAREYRVRFRDARGAGPAPVVVQGNVFLYDLRSNALHLPPAFTWDVTAVLPDGSEVVTPPRRFAGHDAQR